MSSPRSPAYIGADVGSSGCKAVLIQGGRVVAEAWAGYPTRRTLDGSAEQDARAWLRALETTVRKCARSLRRGTIEGIGLTAPAHNAVLVEADGSPRRAVVLWCDARPSAVGDELRRTLGKDFAERTGVRLDGSWTVAQLVWMRRQQPTLYRGLSRILVGKDYLRFCLTGVSLTDPTDAAGTGMYDPVASTWLDAPSELGEIARLLPPIASATASGGTICRAASRRLGLAAGTPVVVGATDTAAELVSIGAVAVGGALVKVATTGTVVIVSGEPMRDPMLLSYPHPLSGLWYSVAATSSAAAAYAWLARMFGNRETELHRADAAARRVAPGAGGVLFLPFLEGERTPYWDRDLRAAFLGLSAAHARAHLYRAVLEGVAFSLRTCWETHLRAGSTPLMPTLSGGGLASKLWREIVVAALGVPAQRVEPHGPALGAALLAAQGITETAPTIARRRVVHQPDQHWAAVYSDLYRVYIDAVVGVTDLSHRLAGDRHSRREHRR